MTSKEELEKRLQLEKIRIENPIIIVREVFCIAFPTEP